MAGTPTLSNLSKNGFLLLFGEVNGLDLPIVANFWPLLSPLVALFLLSSGELLIKGLVVVVVALLDADEVNGFKTDGGFSFD